MTQRGSGVVHTVAFDVVGDDMPGLRRQAQEFINALFVDARPHALRLEYHIEPAAVSNSGGVPVAWRASVEGSWL